MLKIELKPELLAAIQRQIGDSDIQDSVLAPAGTLTGGQINSTVTLVQGSKRYFVKLNAAERGQMFAAERDALEELRFRSTLRIPAPLALGEACGVAFLVLEYLELHPHGDSTALGCGLAALHRNRSEQFGWRRDNTIGTTPQHNPPDDDWPRFWSRHRLGYQLELAARRGYPDLREQAAGLLENPDAFFSTYQPRPSLLHGDLWCGNVAYLQDGTPAIYDPATYYGDRETDLAMTELFGGFSEEFYAAYASEMPLDPGYTVRRYYYQLYHVLNHLNLFGSGYLARSRSLISRLLAELR